MMSKREEQAKHNEELCDHLLGLKKYNDWVVTTAFYAAIHYVEDAIFPHKVGYKEYPTFSHYFDGAGSRDNKHVTKHKLVVERIPTAQADYKWLMDACSGARYTDYLVSDAKAKQANERLKKVRTACIHAKLANALRL